MLFSVVAFKTRIMIRDEAFRQEPQGEFKIVGIIISPIIVCRMLLLLLLIMIE